MYAYVGYSVKYRICSFLHKGQQTDYLVCLKSQNSCDVYAFPTIIELCLNILALSKQVSVTAEPVTPI